MWASSPAKPAVHAGRGEDSQAMAAYQLALLMDESRADIWFNYATLQRRMGLLADAVESFGFALRENPTLYAARYSLGRVLQEIGQPLSAQEKFREVTQDRPRYLPAWRRLIQITWELGAVQSAREYVREALAQIPGDAELLALQHAMADTIWPQGSDMQGVSQSA